MSDPTPDLQAAEEELERIRARTLELEVILRGAHHHATPGPVAFGLEARERLLSEAEQIAHVGSFAWDVVAGTIHWSDELHRILGYEPGSIVPTTEAFFLSIEEADRPRVQEVAGRGVATGVADPVDFRVHRPDGTRRHVQMSGSALRDAEGRATRFVGAIIDQTDRVVVEAEIRRREEVLRMAQRIGRAGSFEWNPVTLATTWSEGLYEICGIPTSQPASQQLYFSLVHPDDVGRLVSVASTIGPGEPVPPMEYRLIRPDGVVVDVYAEASPMVGPNGEPSGVVGTVLDITHRKRLEAQLLQSQKMEALGRLAGGVAHDFNNLLTVIGLHVDVLRRKTDGNELTEVAHAVDRAAALTRQLLAFSRQGVFEHRRIDPAATICDSVRMVRRIVGDDVDLSFAAETNLGAVEVDSTQLEQVVMNLVVNARDARRAEGHVAVTLSAVHVTESPLDVDPPIEPGDYVVLCVDDDGVGMDADVRARAFEPFFTTKSAGSGTGLGLAMVFGIVRNCRGGVSVSSAKNVGTSVRAYFPRFETEFVAPESDGPVTVEAGWGQRILLVDDNTAILRILTTVLDGAGYRVHAASSGEAALALFDLHPDDFALVVTDVVMPGMGGVELVRTLRARDARLPALYISGFSKESPADEEAAACGSLLRKPFLPAELLARIAQVVRNESRVSGVEDVGSAPDDEVPRSKRRSRSFR